MCTKHRQFLKFRLNLRCAPPYLASGIFKTFKNPLSKPRLSRADFQNLYEGQRAYESESVKLKKKKKTGRQVEKQSSVILPQRKKVARTRGVWGKCCTFQEGQSSL